jgi:hypothetical protein
LKILSSQENLQRRKKKMFKYFVVLCITLVSAGSFSETASQLTSNVIEGMKDAAREHQKITIKDKNAAIRAMKAVRDQFPAYCVKVLGDSQKEMAKSESTSPKMHKLKTAYQTVILLEMGAINMTAFAMHPELASNFKTSMAKRDLTDLVPSLDKRGWGKKKGQGSVDQFDKFQMDVMQGALKVLESDDTLELIVEAL